MRSLLFILFTIISVFCYGQFGLYASAAYINVNGSSSFFNNTAPGLGQDIGGNNFIAADFGIFQQNSGSLVLVGGEIKTFKGINDNVCSGTLNYTVYQTGSRPVSPVFSAINLGFFSDCFAPGCGSFFGSYDAMAGGGCCSERDQKWQNPGFGVAANVDLTNRSIGSYTLEIYYSYTGEDGGNGCGTTKYDNNNNNATNYTAGFIITPTMPVSFCNIRVQNSGSSNKIYWNTYAEADTKDFMVQRSGNGLEFNSIGILPAAGSSSTEKNYSFIDRLPLNGMNYYRIRMNETTGRSANSVIVSTKNGSKNNWYLSANPAINNITIAGLEKGDQLILFNAYGAVINKAIAVANVINISCANYAEGSYFIKLINNRGSDILPVIVSH